jgi:ribonuclease R
MQKTRKVKKETQESSVDKQKSSSKPRRRNRRNKPSAKKSSDQKSSSESTDNTKKRSRNRSHSSKQKTRSRSGARHNTKTFVSEQDGLVRVHPDGYGFFIPEDTSNSDAFIAPRRLKGAMHGDQVRVKVYQDRRNRFEAEVIEIKERSNDQVVGEFFIRDEQAYVRARINGPKLLIHIPKRSQKKAQAGDLVIVEISSFKKPIQGKVKKVLGAKSTELVELQAVYEKYHLSEEFPRAVNAEAQKIARKGVDSIKGRVDLRDKGFVTIDGETAKDFDDAIYVEKFKANYKLYVSIADVSYYVKPGTALDKEAKQRANSVYFPQHCIPMLPEELSNGLCSLVPHEDRLTFTAEIILNDKAEVVSSKLYKSVIKSQARLTYNWVNAAILEKDKEKLKDHPKVAPMLRLAVRLAKKIRKLRFKRGTIDFDLPDKVFEFDESGYPINILRSERNFAHMMIEEFMIMANEVVATFSIKKALPFLYRVHDKPDEDKVKTLQVLLHNLACRKKVKPDSAPADFAAITSWAKGRPEERMINHVILRSMKQAVYSHENNGHFGLASERYSHFTSPIRRYPDLIIHRILAEYLRLTEKSSRSIKKTDLSFSAGELAQIASHCSQQERTAMEAEWEVQDLRIAQFMQDKIGLDYSGNISRVTKFGLYVELQDFFVSGLVHVEDLEDDYYEYDPAQFRLIGKRHKRQFKIGEPLEIQVSTVSLEKREVRFVLN